MHRIGLACWRSDGEHKAASWRPAKPCVLTDKGQQPDGQGNQH